MHFYLFFVFLLLSLNACLHADSQAMAVGIFNIDLSGSPRIIDRFLANYRSLGLILAIQFIYIIDKN